MKVITIEELKDNIFEIFDQIIETKEPVYIKYKGKMLKIILVEE